MNRLCSILATVGLVVALAGCGKDSPPPEAPAVPDKPKNEAPPAPPPPPPIPGKKTP
jgi:hypothetical protein